METFAAEWVSRAFWWSWRRPTNISVQSSTSEVAAGRMQNHLRRAKRNVPLPESPWINESKTYSTRARLVRFRSMDILTVYLSEAIFIGGPSAAPSSTSTSYITKRSFCAPSHNTRGLTTDHQLKRCPPAAFILYFKLFCLNLYFNSIRRIFCWRAVAVLSWTAGILTTASP